MFDSIDDDAFEQKICMSVVRLRSVHGGRVLHGVPVRLRRAVVRPSAVRRQGAAGPRVRLSTVRRKVSVPHDCQLPSAHHQRTSSHYDQHLIISHGVQLEYVTSDFK